MENKIVDQGLMTVGAPNIWSQPPVGVEPAKWLESWQIYKVISSKSPMENFGFHFIGYDIRCRQGAVSSKIDQFDPAMMRGVTRSGRIYQLVGMPGSDPDAQHTINGWIQVNQAVVQNATQEFIQNYHVDLDRLSLLYL